MSTLSNAFPLDPGKGPRSCRRQLFFVGWRTVYATFGAVLSLVATSGCGSSQRHTQPEIKAEGQELFGSNHEAPSGPASGQAGENTWSIVIVAFRGPDQESNAAVGLAKARTVGGLHDAYTQSQGKTTIIAYGHYPSPDSAQAQADLKRIREMTVDGGRPFAGAVLAPPPGAGTGRLPELDLRHAKAAFGRDALYTLQIAVYGHGDGLPPQSDAERTEFVRAAEDAAAQLRREGEQAFYYHGPTMSIVTIGIFGPDDFDPQHPELLSDRLRAAEEAHPYNLLNGKGMKVRTRGVPENSPDAKKMATSFVVAVPAEE